MQKVDHSGHRNRLREKYIEHGIEALAPHEVIEMLLFNAVPYRNTNDIAKILLDRFGSLSAVFDASIEQLMNAGLTKNQAAFLKMIPDVTRLYAMDRYDNPSKIVDFEELPSYIINLFIGYENEERVILLLLDKKMKELYCGVVAEGTFNNAAISIRKIISLALNYGAVAAVLAHNHPSGFALPSQSDYKTTIKIRDSLSNIGVDLIDHYVVADGDCVSMHENGLF